MLVGPRADPAKLYDSSQVRKKDHLEGVVEQQKTWLRCAPPPITCRRQSKLGWATTIGT
jgi:hypothetical protein